MSTWIKLLPMQLADISANHFREPHGELERTDNVVGVMSDDLKRLYTLWIDTQMASEQLVLEAKFAFKQNERDSSFTRAFELRTKTEVLEKIFWVSLRDEFGLWDKPGVGIRANYQVVWFDSPQPKSIFDMLFGH